MTAAGPRPDPQAAPDPLAMALNTVYVVRDAAEVQHSDPVQATVIAAGKQGMDAAIVGACLAAISIAADVRELRVLPGAVAELRVHVAELRADVRHAADALGRVAGALEEGALEEGGLG